MTWHGVLTERRSEFLQPHPQGNSGIENLANVSICSLPDLVLALVLSWLPRESSLSVLLVSKQFNRVSIPIFWKKLVLAALRPPDEGLVGHGKACETDQDSTVHAVYIDFATRAFEIPELQLHSFKVLKLFLAQKTTQLQPFYVVSNRTAVQQAHLSQAVHGKQAISISSALMPQHRYPPLL
jgi:hypothetical protein